MIYLFTWNNEFLLKEEVKKWKEKFIWGFWEFNLTHIKKYDDININFISETLLWSSFLSDKKLIILDDIPLSLSLKNKKTLSNILEIEDYIYSILDKIPDSNIVLFSSWNIDKRSKIYKKIKEIWKITDFSDTDISNIPNIIKSKFWDIISRDWLNELIRYKSWNLTKIVSDIEKLSLTSSNIKADDIKKNIIPELEESIFSIIDLILEWNKKSLILESIDSILNSINIYAFYNTLLSNLRFYVYIWKLRSLKYSSNDISNILNLWKRSWLIDKKKFSYSRIQKIYFSLIELDKKNKTWELLWTTDLDFRFELEKIILEN